MQLSKKQIGAYHSAASRAWKEWAPGNRKSINDKDTYEKWRLAELEKITGRESIKDVGWDYDFVRMMAHWESFIGDSITWTLKAQTEVFRKVRHVSRAAFKFDCPDFDTPYVLAIAQQMNPDLESLDQCTHHEVINLIVALKVHLRRQLANPSESPHL